MLCVTKIFRFEMAHAICGYSGACKDIHGHSYELHVTVAAECDERFYIQAPGFIADFKDIKKWVQASVIEKFDHSLLLSAAFIETGPGVSSLKNLIIFEAEPTAENLLINIKHTLLQVLPVGLNLIRLKLFETKDAYAEWSKQ